MSQSEFLSFDTWFVIIASADRWESTQGWSPRIGRRRHGKSRLGCEIYSGSKVSSRYTPSETSESYFDDQSGATTAASTAISGDHGSNGLYADQEERFSMELSESQEKPSTQRFQCHHCSNSYSDRRGLKRHLDKIDGKLYQCEICLKTFARNDVYKRHVKLVHGKFYKPQGVDDYYCDLTVRLIRTNIVRITCTCSFIDSQKDYR